MEMYDAGVSDASKTNSDLQIRVDEMEITITGLESDIDTKNDRIAELEDALSESTEDNETLTAELEDITAEKEELEDLVARLRADLEEYQNNVQELVYVNFYVDNEIVETKAIRVNGSILTEVETPEKEGYIFSSWQLDNVDIDITTYEFDEDTDLVASFDIDPDSFLAYLQSNLTDNNCIKFSMPLFSYKVVFKYDNGQIIGRYNNSICDLVIDSPDNIYFVDTNDNIIELTFINTAEEIADENASDVCLKFSNSTGYGYLYFIEILDVSEF